MKRFFIRQGIRFIFAVRFALMPEYAFHLADPLREAGLKNRVAVQLSAHGPLLKACAPVCAGDESRIVAKVL
jgi:hypothetical protein